MSSANPDPAADETLRAWLLRADPTRANNPGPGAEAARTARQLAQAAGQAELAARATSWLCAHLFRQGQMAELRLEARYGLPQMASPALDAERCETLRLLALAGCESGAFDVALEAAHTLVREGARLADPGVALTAAYALGACFERMGDSWQAMRVLQEAVENHGAEAPARPRLLALNGLCVIAIGAYHRLREVASSSESMQVLERARRAGDAARELIETGRDPAAEVAVFGNLGEVVLRQGELALALRYLQQARQLADEHGLVASGWRVRTSMGDWLMQQGRATEAVQAMQELLADMGTGAPPQTEIRARDCAYRAERALGNAEAALAHFEVMERLERRRAVGQLRAQSELFVTRSEAQQAQWQAEQARRDAREERARAETDPLTGLGNRRHFERRMAELLPAVERSRSALAVVMVDLDHFKSINDGHGHAAGDAVIMGLARLMREATRADDLLARLGGEEFVMVLPGMAVPQAVARCNRLRQAMAAQHWPGMPAAHPVTASFGVAVPPPYDKSKLLARADGALYEAKGAGRNRVCVAAA